MRGYAIATALWTFGVLTAVFPAEAVAKTYVLPVVVTGAPGVNGSYWQSELRVVDDDASTIVVRRKWVALPEGGFVDDPATAPSWEIGAYVGPGFAPPRVLILSGGELLKGTGSTHGAVALEIEKGIDSGFEPDSVLLFIANTGGDTMGGDPNACCLAGNGQLVKPATGDPTAFTTLGWGTSDLDRFRTNVGLVNPNDRAITVTVDLWVYERYATTPNDYWRWKIMGSFAVVLPALGWLQVNDMLASKLDEICPGGCSWLFDAPAPLFLQAWTGVNEGSPPFYAYVSSIHTPTNDPLFIAGYD